MQTRSRIHTYSLVSLYVLKSPEIPENLLFLTDFPNDFLLDFITYETNIGERENKQKNPKP